VAKGIGTGRGYGNPGAADQFQSHRVRRHAYPHQRPPGGHCIRDRRRARQQQRQRPWPEGFHQPASGFGDLGDQSIQYGQVGNVHNDWVPRRPLLGLEDLPHSVPVQRIGAQTVDGLRGQRHQSACAQNLRSPVERLLRLGSFQLIGVHNQPQGLHRSIVAFRAPRMPPAVYSLLPMPVETEIKFRVNDLAGLAGLIQAAGFRLQTPRSFESNVLYDTPDRQMRARTEILRIRSYAGRYLLTHKRLPDTGPGEDTHKHRVETETEVSDGDALAQVFISLGLVAAFRYEKWRTEWEDGEGHCVVDETPIGDFAELEGPAEWIDRTARRLDIEQDKYITLSYGRLFDLWREQQGSAAQDLTFAAVSGSSART